MNLVMLWFFSFCLIFFHLILNIGLILQLQNILHLLLMKKGFVSHITVKFYLVIIIRCQFRFKLWNYLIKCNRRIRPFKNYISCIYSKITFWLNFVKNKPFCVDSLFAIDLPLFCFRFSPTANDIPHNNKINLNKLTFFIFYDVY